MPLEEPAGCLHANPKWHARYCHKRASWHMPLFKRQYYIFWKQNTLKGRIFIIPISFLLKIHTGLWLESGILTHLLPSIIQSLDVKLQQVASFPQNHRHTGSPHTKLNIRITMENQIPIHLLLVCLRNACCSFKVQLPVLSPAFPVSPVPRAPALSHQLGALRAAVSHSTHRSGTVTSHDCASPCPGHSSSPASSNLHPHQATRKLTTSPTWYLSKLKPRVVGRLQPCHRASRVTCEQIFTGQCAT